MREGGSRRLGSALATTGVAAGAVVDVSELVYLLAVRYSRRWGGHAVEGG